MKRRFLSLSRGFSTLFGACLLLSAAACSSVERETVDRVTPHDTTAWTSRSDCEELLAKREPSSHPPRVGTWNIRFFPDSVEGKQPDPDEATDVEWAACAIASLDVAVLVVQEFKNSEVGLSKQAELIERLNTLTGGDWQLELDQCMPKDVQHPGFLFDKSQVHGESFRELAELSEGECNNIISPGFAGYFSIDGGPDFHLIAVHGHTGDAKADFEARMATAAALEAAAKDAYDLNPDTDVLVAGDFNSVGCVGCSPALSNEDEIAELDQTVASFDPALALLPKSEACTRVASDMPQIDHIIAAASMAEVPDGSVVHVAGICEEIRCERQVNWLEDAYDRLSDHCPLLLDLASLDDD